MRARRRLDCEVMRHYSSSRGDTVSSANGETAMIEILRQLTGGADEVLFVSVRIVVGAFGSSDFATSGAA